MTTEHRWNLNILCVDAQEDVLKLYQDVLTSSADQFTSVTQKYVNSAEFAMPENTYRIFPAMSGKTAIRTSLEAKQRQIEIGVGFFDIGIKGEVDGLECIREVKRIFPSLLCAVVTEINDQGVRKIQNLFDSQDEWLYIKKPFSKEELLQTACNLVVSWNLRGEQTIAMETIKESKERIQRLLIVTPKLFRQQSYSKLCENVVREASDMMETNDAFLAMKENKAMQFTAGIGKFEPKTDEDKQRFLKVLDNPLHWDKGCLVPLSVVDLPLGILFLDELSPDMRDTELLELFASQAAYAFENLRIQAEREEQKAKEQELKIGKNIQQSLLPKTIPESDDIELYGLMNSAKEIGGDYYDFIERETQDLKLTGDIFVSIGDVAGKGVAAGLIMSEVRSFIRALVPFYASPYKILDLVARLLEKDIWGTGKFMSVLLMLWKIKEKKFSFTSAGHEHIIHYIAKKKKCSVFKAGGVVLGLKHKIVSPNFRERELYMEKDDVVVLFTDGATEAMNAEKDMFSLEKIVSLTEEYAHLSPDQILNNIFQKICEFIGEVEQFDDITMVAIKRK